MKFKWLDQNLAYDGSQLRSLFGYLDHGVLGDSMIGWVGPCNIPSEKIVDGEDLLAGSVIEGSQMLHFIIEVFGESLFSGVALQRLMATQIQTLILNKCALNPADFVRKGDDLFFKGGKLNISIATQSPTSTLIHFAVNVSNTGTPVKTASLEDFRLEPAALAEELSAMFIDEFEDIKKATMKVKWVR